MSEAALRLTGLDRTTLATCAHVARRVPSSSSANSAGDITFTP
jgi:hypothetical protein